MRLLGMGVALAALLAPMGSAMAAKVVADRIWTYQHIDVDPDGDGEAQAEIPAYDAARHRLFVVGEDGVDVLDATDGSFIRRLDVVDPTSVAVFGDRVAVAVPNANPQDFGTVQIFDATNLDAAPASVSVGALPDMVTFNKDGTKILVANEGEPNSYGQIDSVDPEGSVSIIDVGTLAVTTASFSGFSAGDAGLENLRVFGPGATLAQDVEPEYIAVSPDNTTAYVALQENNGIAIVDIATSTVTEIVPLGFKDHSADGNGLDPSDRDDDGDTDIHINTYANLFGMYQPDAIAAYEVGGQTYIVTANEGDAREYDGFEEEDRVKDLTLDSGAFPDAAIQDDDQLGRLTVTLTLGDLEPDGEYEELYAFGGRSFSILDENGAIIWDSGDMIEQIIAALFPELWQDGRSDNKGPEPEGVTIGLIGDRYFAFIGLERTSMVMMFDITDPMSPFYLDTIFTDGDVSPEGLAFFDYGDKSYLAVSNEVSSTTSLYQIIVPEPATLALFGGGVLALFGFRRRR